MTIGAAIRKIRERQNLQQQDLARRVSENAPDEPALSAAVLSQIESGRIVSPSRDRLRAIARGLGVPYNDMLLEAGWIDPPATVAQDTSPDDALLRELALDNPELMAQLKQLRAQNSDEAYRQARAVIARFFRMGIETASDLAKDEQRTPAHRATRP